jgi:hypothetical protein
MCDPEVLSTNDFTVYAYGMATDASHVYVGFQHSLRAIPKTGGVAVDVCSSGDSVGGLAVQGSTVYWSGIFTGAVYACANDGSTPQPTTLGHNPTPYLNRVAVDADAVYVASHDTAIGDVAKIPIAGGPATVLDMDAHAHHGVLLDQGFAYFESAGSLRRAPKDASSGAQTVAASPDGTLNGFAIDDGDAYLACGGGIYRVPKAGGAPTLLQASAGQGDVWGIAVDAARVYWRRSGASGDIWAWNKDGSGALRLATKQSYSLDSGAGGFTTDEGFVYWVAATGSASGPPYNLYRTPK